eukprot:gb/GEZN01011336.1/.p1 GENE.gb/GEZN01011336.1/~~gb/GEZN01011336.1/.p1  ORF type:complete len:311 (-),score=25.28 gb/GEZN01011336.1/:146-1078(-)
MAFFRWKMFFGLVMVMLSSRAMLAASEWDEHVPCVARNHAANASRQIPRVIYQTYEFDDSTNSCLQNKIARFMSANPGYERRFFNGKDRRAFIKQYFDSDMLHAYDKLHVGAAEADLWRYAVMYEKGGVYLDIDGSFGGSLDTIIRDHDQAVITREHNEGTFVQGMLIFAPRHPLLRHLLQTSVDKILDPKNSMSSPDDLLHTTGTYIFSDAVAYWWDMPAGRQQLWQSTNPKDFCHLSADGEWSARLYSANFASVHIVGECKMSKNRWALHWRREVVRQYRLSLVASCLPYALVLVLLVPLCMRLKARL